MGFFDFLRYKPLAETAIVEARADLPAAQRAGYEFDIPYGGL